MNVKYVVQRFLHRDLIFWSFAYCLTISESSCQPGSTVVEYDAGVEDDDGPNNNPVAKAAYPFPFRSADAWHMVHRHPAELDLSSLLSKGSRK